MKGIGRLSGKMELVTFYKQFELPGILNAFQGCGIGQTELGYLLGLVAS